MRGWQCKICRGWKPKNHTETITERGKICQNCKSAEIIRAEAQREAKANQQNKNDDDWDLGERQCNIDDEECESCQ